MDQNWFVIVVRIQFQWWSFDGWKRQPGEDWLRLLIWKDTFFNEIFFLFLCQKTIWASSSHSGSDSSLISGQVLRDPKRMADNNGSQVDDELGSRVDLDLKENRRLDSGLRTAEEGWTSCSGWTTPLTICTSSEGNLDDECYKTETSGGSDEDLTWGADQASLEWTSVNDHTETQTLKVKLATTNSSKAANQRKPFIWISGQPENSLGRRCKLWHSVSWFGPSKGDVLRELQDERLAGSKPHAWQTRDGRSVLWWWAPSKPRTCPQHAIVDCSAICRNIQTLPTSTHAYWQRYLYNF